MEYGNLRDLGSGQAVTSAGFREASITLHTTPIPDFHCPSRRPARTYLTLWVSVREQTWLGGASGTAQTIGVVKGDYAANCGDSREFSGDIFYRPTSYANIREELWTPTTFCPPRTGDPRYDQYVNHCQTGIMHYRSKIKIAKILDGTSKTYLVGEKWVPSNGYDGVLNNSTPGFSWGENQSLFTGFEWDNGRVAWGPNQPEDPEFVQPAQDYAGLLGPQPESKFGSAHPGSFHVVFCDGSVQSIAYDIDPIAHHNYAHRYDGEEPLTLP
jgi:prepilin-type processing-associated H-X9-DG protein